VQSLQLLPVKTAKAVLLQPQYIITMLNLMAVMPERGNDRVEGIYCGLSYYFKKRNYPGYFQENSPIPFAWIGE